MSTSGGQLCARARFWTSLRLDGELSELEGALLDAHLAQCPDCGAFTASAEASTAALRDAAPDVVAHIAVTLPASPRRVFAGVVAAAVVVSAALLGGLGDGSHPTQGSSLRAARAVATVSSADTPDQLRRLRRTDLLNTRRMPREMSYEPA
jgi:hypothetical protein